MSTRVLVTGATGFIAGHCIAELLEHGYAVRATVRDVTATEGQSHLRELAERHGGALEFVQANLDRDDGWSDAVRGCDFVMHVASPFPSSPPKDENELIRPAVDGTLRVLRAAAESGTVKRVVLTSSIAAVVAGHDRQDRAVRTEQDWSVLERSSAYQKSKTLAERAAWDFVRDVPLELTVINPGMVLGPVQRASTGTSVDVIRRLMSGEIPGTPHIGFATVDVRDLAVAHRLALEVPAAAGNRYICAGDPVWMQEMARILDTAFREQGFRVPTRELPNWLVRLVALFDRNVRLSLDFLDRKEIVSADKARTELSWTMRPVRESIVDTASSLIELGVVAR